MKKWFIIAIVLGAGAWGFVQLRGWQGNSSAADPSKRPTSAVVELRDIRFTVSIAGEISPAEQVSVRPEVNGIISKLPVDVGDLVTKGSLLFSLDDKDLQIEIASRETEIAAANLQLDKANRDYERDKKLFEEKLVSREVFENSKTTYELAQNNIVRAERNLDLAKDRLSKTKIAAPFDCTILTRPVSAGQAVAGSGGFNSGTEVLTIADLNEMIINAHVNQADVTHLKVGMEVDVQVEAVTGLNVKGIVERIAPQATIRNNIKGFSARIVLKNISPSIRPGMTAIISVPVASANSVLAVPLAAVFTEHNPDTDQNERVAYVKKGTMYERRLIQTGISDYFNAQVVAGLNPGEIVSLVQPQEELIINTTKGNGLAAGGAGPGTAGPAGSGPGGAPRQRPARSGSF